MDRRPITESRRHDLPPLWSVPLLLIAGIAVILVAGSTLGLPGILIALAVIAWLQPKVDAYVRRRESGS